VKSPTKVLTYIHLAYYSIPNTDDCYVTSSFFSITKSIIFRRPKGVVVGLDLTLPHENDEQQGSHHWRERITGL
jgi:hypothetical protein